MADTVAILTIQDLNTDVFYHIAQYLNTSDFLSLIGTCTQLRDKLDRPVCWAYRAVRLSELNQQTAELLNSRLVKSIRLDLVSRSESCRPTTSSAATTNSDADDRTDNLGHISVIQSLQSATHVTSLRTLIIRGFDLDLISEAELSGALTGNFQQLRCLVIYKVDEDVKDRTCYTMHAQRKFVQMLFKLMPDLEELYIQQDYSRGLFAENVIETAASYLPKLINLEFKSVGSTGNGAFYRPLEYHDHLNGPKNLQRLAGLSMRVYDDIAKAFKSIRHLNFGYEDYNHNSWSAPTHGFGEFVLENLTSLVISLLLCLPNERTTQLERFITFLKRVPNRVALEINIDMVSITSGVSGVRIKPTKDQVNEIS